MSEAEDWGATPEEFAAAQTAVELALASARKLLTLEEEQLLRDDLLAYLLGSPAGRAALREVLDRPAPEQSGDVAKQPPDGSTIGAGTVQRKQGGGSK